MQPGPGALPDRLSARWLLALGSRLVQEVGALLTGAARAGQAGRHLRHRRAGAVRLRGRPGGVRRGADRKPWPPWSAATTTSTPRAAATTASSSGSTRSGSEPPPWTAARAARSRDRRTCDDASASRSSYEDTLAATPEQVWEAIATGPGIDSWFMGRNEVEPREGGSGSLTMPGFTGESTITAWEPPHRFAYRGTPAEDGGFMAFEYLVEGRDGGSTVLRLVHSGMLAGDWEDEYDALRKGWPFYLRTLEQYLAHFPGRTAVPVTAFGPQQSDQERAWAGIVAAVGLTGSVIEGDKVRFTLDGQEVTGVVDIVAGARFPRQSAPTTPCCGSSAAAA